MHHFSAPLPITPRAGSTKRLHRSVDALPGARRLLVYTTLAVVMLTVTVLGAIIYAVGQIDEAAVKAEITRASVAVSAVAPSMTEEEIADSMARLFALKGAHLGATADVNDGETSVPVPGHDDRVLIWSPVRIGSDLFVQLAPARLAASTLFLGGILLLMRRLYYVAKELDERRQEAQALAARDPLTGLGNRLSFDEGLPRMLSAEADEVALLCLDLDGFKQVNDSFGHGAGDDVLRIVGQRLGGLVRSTDMVARIGGDEFAIVLQRRGGRDDGLSAFARRVEAALVAPILLGSTQVQIGASIGIAVAPADGRDATTLMLAADAALYRAKRDRSGFAMATAA